MLRQQRLFSAMYIGGTALAIATTTLFVIMYYVKIAPVYPEYNRSRIHYLDRGGMNYKTGGIRQSRLSYEFLRDNILTLKDVDEVSLYIDTDYEENYVADMQGYPCIKVSNKPTDPAFFNIYNYEFIDGGPFTQDDLESRNRVAVITDALAEKTFGSTDGIIGKDITMNFISYRVCGVVRTASLLTPTSFADIFIPYTVYPDYDKEWAPCLGKFHALVLSDDSESLRAQVSEIERRYNTSQDEMELDMYSQPKNHITQTFNPNANDKFSLVKMIKGLIMILMVMLLVPALNLGGMISSRMEMRMSELGVRKSFGATRGALLSHVLWENLLLTILGGIVGLVLCWCIIWFTSGDILAMADSSFESHGSPATVNADMLFSPWIFMISFLLCVLLNLLSALIPACISLRRPIVSSLKEK